MYQNNSFYFFPSVNLFVQTDRGEPRGEKSPLGNYKNCHVFGSYYIQGTPHMRRYPLVFWFLEDQRIGDRKKEELPLYYPESSAEDAKSLLVRISTIKDTRKNLRIEIATQEMIARLQRVVKQNRAVISKQQKSNVTQGCFFQPIASKTVFNNNGKAFDQLGKGCLKLKINAKDLAPIDTLYSDTSQPRIIP